MTDEYTLEELTAKIDEYTNLRKELAKTRGEEIVKSLLAPLFDFNSIHSVSFKGYIPSFNDGDPCVFILRNDLVFNGIDEGQRFEDAYDSEEYGIDLDLELEPFGTWEADYYTRDGKTYLGLSRSQFQDFIDKSKEVSRWLGNNSDFIEDVFGSNFRVVLTRTKFVVEDYDCGY